MEKNDSSEKIESGFTLGQPMPSRRATRHVEKIQILNETSKDEVVELDLSDIEDQEQSEGSQKKLSFPKIQWKKPDKKTILKIVLGVVALLIVAAVITGIVVYAQKDKNSGYSVVRH